MWHAVNKRYTSKLEPGSTYTKVFFLFFLNKKNNEKVIRISTVQDSDRPNVNNHCREKRKYSIIVGTGNKVSQNYQKFLTEKSVTMKVNPERQNKLSTL